MSRKTLAPDRLRQRLAGRDNNRAGIVATRFTIGGENAALTVSMSDSRLRVAVKPVAVKRCPEGAGLTATLAAAAHSLMPCATVTRHAAWWRS